MFQVDRLLSRGPLDVGESREGDNRILFVEPLAVTFRVEARLSQVTILHVRLFRRRK